MVDAERVQAAASRFQAFFEELETAFFERDDVIAQVALALLAKEHVLVSGPPGTAKSQLAKAVFGRIVCAETGSPSVYSRQITESTVHTDLIGPIDFKQLTETGRTEHFTDEGILGAAHAFLDEVFDGRDMLLRTALNVLQERELKQGTKVTRGQIEVALMTSNRYIADVLEQSRETLLAFVDRIAFVSFVPRGFADDENMKRVLRRHVGGARDRALDALLTIQDLDALQALVDEVVVSEPICDALARFLASLDGEMAAAVRADPKFVPTRYFSTRTAVRCGKILRAICVRDWIARRGNRELQVLQKDFAELRLHLLLAGPSIGAIGTLLGRETDPHERRQLEIVRTEREVFERCLAKLPMVGVPKLPKPSAATAKVVVPTAPRRDAPAKELAPLEEAVRSRDVAAIVGAMSRLSKLATADDPQLVEEARSLLERAVSALEQETTRAALQAAEAGELTAGVERLVEVATSLPDETQSLHEVARWLRQRAAQAIDDLTRFALGSSAADLARGIALSVDEAETFGARRIELLRRLGEMRRRTRGADAPFEERDERWHEAVRAMESDIGVAWDAAFCASIGAVLASDPKAPLPEVLRTLTSPIERLKAQAQALSELSGRPSALERKALGSRLSDLVAALMRRIDLVDRATLDDEIDAVLAILRDAGVAEAIQPRDWLAWSAEALCRAADAPAVPSSYDHAGYRQLRRDEDRIPVAYALAEIALRLGQADGGPRPGLLRVAELLAELPETTQDALVAIDRDRVERALGYLERWWEALAAGELGVEERLQRIIKSRFFEILWDESALARFSLELQLTVDVLPRAAEPMAALRARIVALDEVTRRGAEALLRQRSDEAWKAAIARAEGS